MKYEDIKEGDLVKVMDGSYAVRVDSYTQDRDHIGKLPYEFEVLEKVCRLHDFRTSESQFVTSKRVHDIYIQDTTNKRIYLHSAAFVELAKPKTFKITIEVTDEQARAVRGMLK